MKWKLQHMGVLAEENSEIKSRSFVILELSDNKCVIADTGKHENHVLGSKKVLVDAANKLENMAREMKKHADKLY